MRSCGKSSTSLKLLILLLTFTLLFSNQVEAGGVGKKIGDGFKKVGEGIKKGVDAVGNVVGKATGAVVKGVTDVGIRATEGIVRAVGKGKEADDLEKKRQGIVDKVGEKTEKFVGHAAPNLIGLGISAATFNPVGIAANTIGLGGSIARDSIEEANEGKGNDKVNKGTRVAGDVASGISTANTVLGFLRRRSRSTGVGNNGAHEFSGQHKRLVFIEARNSYY